ncbi:Nucleoside diphosphate kinase 1-like protein, partial [Drosera capensis]
MDTLLVEGLFHDPFKYNPEPVFPYSGNNQSRVNHDHELSYHDGNNLVVDDFLYLNDLNEGDIDIARSAGSNPHGDASESGDFSDACLKYMSEILMEENLEELCLRPLRIATLIKPDGVQRGLVGEIISRFEKKGFTLRGLKLLNVERSFAEQHYADLSAKSFFNGLVDYIISGPVVAMVWEGK